MYQVQHHYPTASSRHVCMRLSRLDVVFFSETIIQIGFLMIINFTKSFCEYCHCRGRSATQKCNMSILFHKVIFKFLFSVVVWTLFRSYN